MDRVRCEWAACEDCAVVHFLRVERRVPVEERHVCRRHAREVFGQMYSRTPCAIEGPQHQSGAVTFDLDFMFLDEAAQEGAFPYFVNFREVAGRRRFGFRTGFSEYWALDGALRPSPSPYIPTHELMRRTVELLGGRVECVVVRDFIVTEQRHCTELQIRQGQSMLATDIRLSDAAILAVTCDVPIFALEETLAKFREPTWPF